MENQHRKVKGYRELSQGEIDLMNEVKELGAKFESLIEKIETHIGNQEAFADEGMTELAAEELARLSLAEPNKWCFSGKMDLQSALMKLTRSIAQPTFF